MPTKPATQAELQAVLDVVQARLNGNPRDYDDWHVVVRQLRQATAIAERLKLEAPEKED